MCGQLADPFGNMRNFLLFMNKKDYSLPVLQVVNETKGRLYLNHYAYQMAKTADYSDLIPKDLAFWVGMGGCYQLKMHDMGEENLNFPRVPFNEGFINWLVKLDPQQPLLQYKGCILAVHTGNFALKAMKLSEHPDLGGFIELAIATATDHAQQWQDLWRKLHPNIPLPDIDNAWSKVTPEVQRRLNWISSEFGHTFDDRQDAQSQVTSTLFDLLDKEMWEKPEIVLDAGLAGKLTGYFKKAVEHDLQDKLKHERKFIQETYPEELTLDTKHPEEGETIPFIETVPSKKPEPWEIVEQRERIQQVYNQAGLTKMERLVADLRAENYAHKDIARRLSEVLNKPVTETTVRQHWSKAQNKLKKYFNKS